MQADSNGWNARGPSQRDAFADRTNLGPDAGASRLLFSSLKGETHTHKTGFKQLFRRLRTLYRPDSLDSRDQFTLKGLSEADVVVFGCPKQKFTASGAQSAAGQDAPPLQSSAQRGSIGSREDDVLGSPRYICQRDLLRQVLRASGASWQQSDTGQA